MNCTRGSYCPYASDKPIKCDFLKRCPPGSSHQDITILTMGCLLLCGVLMLFVQRYYQVVVEYPAAVSLVLIAAIGLMWLVDRFIGGFLTIIFIAIAANYALLQWSSGRCPSFVPRVLLLCTFIVALYVLWNMNPAWSMLIGGMLLCLTICWLMSQSEYRACVLLGRFLLLAAMAGLIFILSHSDPELLMLIGIVLAVGVAWCIGSWMLELCSKQPSGTSSGRSSHGTVARDLLEASMDLTGHVLHNSHSGISARQPPLSASYDRRAASRGRRDPMLDVEMASCATTGVGGVLFSLQDVGFSLPDGTELLKGIDLSILAGSRVAVMGPSGSGKSTLLAVLSGQASYGRVTGKLVVGGEEATDLGFLRHVTGFVPQDDVLHGELTVEDNIRFQASLRLPAGASSRDVQLFVQQVEKDLNLTAIRQARVGTPEQRGISGGQRKRVSIALELVTRPLLLFADEPTSGLDSTTAHEVIGCLNKAAENQGTTVISVIHQPRYETLCLFSDLILLATGGKLVYGGSAQEARLSFQRHLKTQFPQNANPADVMLDVIQPPNEPPEAGLAALRACGRQARAEQGPPSLSSAFQRTKVPFFKAVVVHMDRAMLQTLCAYGTIVVNHLLCAMALFLLCRMVRYQQVDNFLMQSSFAALFLMLLQGIAAQRIFGSDMLNTLREARVGVSVAAYFVAKDLVALLEVSLSAAMFTCVYGALSGMLQELPHLFAGAWAFVYSVFGMSYIFSVCLSPGAAQMSAVAATFVSFCVSGIYTPSLPVLADYLGGRGWMVPALSSVRWFWGYLITAEAHFLTDLSRNYGSGGLRSKGYDLDYLDCSSSGLDKDGAGIVNLRQSWQRGRGCVCSGLNMLLLGIIFRFLAFVCLSLHVHAKTSGWARFFGQYERGAWKLMGRLFALLVGCFLALVLVLEVWIFGIIHVDVPTFLHHLGITS